MRVRMQDANGDYSWGSGNADYYVNDPRGVGQLAVSRLNLAKGEWFADQTQGLDLSHILGNNQKAAYDLAYQDCISGTQGFADYVNYASNRNPNTRALTVEATIDTIYSVSIGAPGLASQITSQTTIVVQI